MPASFYLMHPPFFPLPSTLYLPPSSFLSFPSIPPDHPSISTMAGVKDIDINEKEKDLKESPSQSNTNGQFAVFSPPF